MEDTFARRFAFDADIVDTGVCFSKGKAVDVIVFFICSFFFFFFFFFCFCLLIEMRYEKKTNRRIYFLKGFSIEKSFYSITDLIIRVQ